MNYSRAEANWGCKATSKWLLLLIKKQIPNSRIIKKPVIFLDEDSHENFFKEMPRDIDGIDSYLHSQLNSNPFFEDIEWADIVVLNGEGGMHEYEPWRAEPYLRLLSVYAVKKIFSKKKLIIVNQTVDYWNPNFGEWIKTVYRKCDHLYVREPLSLQRLKSLGLDQAKLVPDAAFLTRSTSPDKVNRFLKRRNINNGFIGLFFGQTMGYADIKKIENYFLNLCNFGRQVVLFAAPWPDFDVAQVLKKKYNVPVIGLEAYPELLCGILKKASIISSGRFHCCILSAIAGTPFVPFSSNTYKIEGLVELLDYRVPVLDFEKSSLNKIMASVNEIWMKRYQLKEIIRRKALDMTEKTISGYRDW